MPATALVPRQAMEVGQPVRVLIHDTLATTPFTVPLAAGWVNPGLPVQVRAGLRAAEVGPEDVALVPAPEIGHLADTHRVAPDAAVVAGAVGAVAMRVPVRPDGVERTPVRLWETSGAAELLARAVMRPFYGIEPTAWTTEETAEAQVVIVEGAEALRPPEAGFSEDLCRAWTILTGEPAVTHALVVPNGSDREDLAAPLAALADLRAAGHERRRDLRRILAETHGLDRDRLHAFFAAQRFALEPPDRRALLLLLQRGARGSSYPTVDRLAFLEPGTG